MLFPHKICDEKNSIGVKELPVVITGLHYYSQSGNIRYKVSSKDSFISGTFSRGELRLQGYAMAKLMGINVAALKKNIEKALTHLQAQKK
jgi:hypothetical protein